MGFQLIFDLESKKFNQVIRLLSVAAILIAILIIYSKTGELGFTNWDDDLYIVESELIKSFNLKMAFTEFTVGLYTPLVSLSYMLDYQLFGLNPEYFHLENVFLHCLVCLLVYVFVFRFSQNEIAAFVTAFLFAIHPLHVEPVAWLSSRKDLLFSIFYLLALIQYLRFLEGRKWYQLVIVTLFFILGVLSKPAAVSFPIVALLMSYFYASSKKLSEYFHLFPLFFIALIMGLITLYGAYELDLRKTPDSGYSYFDYFIFASYGISFYFVKTLFPSNLCNFYAYPGPDEAFPSTYLAAPLVLIALIIAIVYFRRKRKAIFFLIQFSLIMLLPMLRFAPIGFPMVSDRYFYLPSLGFLMIPGIYLAKKGTEKIRFVIIGICTIYSVLFLFISKRQVSVWMNSKTLWSHTLKIYPDFYYGYQERGRYYLSMGNKKAALSDYQRALEIEPNNPDLFTRMANLTAEMGLKDETLALQNAAVESSPSAMNFYNRANTFKANNEFNKAIKDYNKALDLDSTLAEAYNNRGVCKILTNDTSGAFQDFLKAVELDPENAMFLDNYQRIKEMIH